MESDKQRVIEIEREESRWRERNRGSDRIRTEYLIIFKMMERGK